MDIFSKDIIIPITAAILGIAVPLLISVIQRIDDKYKSTRLIQIFMNEKKHKVLYWTVDYYHTFTVLSAGSSA